MAIIPFHSALRVITREDVRGYLAEVAVATTEAVTLSGEQTIDGVVTSASRVLVKNQAAPAQNGVYVTASGAWSRATDADTTAEVYGKAVFVTDGSANVGKTFWCGLRSTETLGTDAHNWHLIEGADLATALSAKANVDDVVAVRAVGESMAYLRRYESNESARPLIANPDTGAFGLWIDTADSTLHSQLELRGAGVRETILKQVFQYFPGVYEYSGDRFAPWSQFDRNGVCLWGFDTIRESGVVFGRYVEDMATGAAGSARLSGRIPLADANVPARETWNGIAGNGQSNSVGGGGSNGAITLSAVYGVETFYDTGVPKPAIASSTTAGALFETTVETAASGTGKGVVEHEAIVAGMAPINNAWFVFEAGVSGNGVYQGKPGTSVYNTRFLPMVENAVTAKGSGNIAFHTSPLVWGESDNLDGRTAAQVETDLDSYVTTASADVITRTGQATPMHSLVFHMAYYADEATGNPAWQLGSFEVVNANPLCHFVTSTDHMTLDADGTHYTAAYRKLIGILAGRATAQIMEGYEPDCVWPLSAVARGTTLTVTFKTPTPLIIDLESWGAATNAGFKVLDGDGTEITQVSQVASGNTIVIELETTPTNNGSDMPQVRYGLDYLGAGMSVDFGASGNVRETTTGTVNIGGTAYPLYLLPPHFKMPISVLEA